MNEIKIDKVIVHDLYTQLKSGFAEPSDEISLDAKVMDILFDYVQPMCYKQTPHSKELEDTEGKDNLVNFIPTDLLFSKTLPLKAFRVIWTDIEKRSVDITFNIKENYIDIIDALAPGKSFVIGKAKINNIKMKDEEGDKNFFANFICVLIVKYQENALGFTTLPSTEYCNYALIPDTELKRKCQRSLDHVMFENLFLWYAIQIFMLNPITKELFSKPKVIRYSIKPKGGKDKKRKIAYKRVHTINAEELENSIYGGDRSFNRKCLCWYVIGHWREYKNGKKVFIQGFWKGALRETKKNYDEGRERIIADNV